ncbi:MAG: hypothetical protein HQM09_07255 [Candidatus Riflebacteria bacterium]|nr:hypothetical protein [Candidatus Riflebacteria bacterium]
MPQMHTSRKDFKSLIPVILLFVCGVVWFFSGVERHWPWTGKYPVGDPDSLLYLRWLDQSNIRGHIITDDTYTAFPDSFPMALPPFFLRLLVYSNRLFYSFFPAETCLPSTIAGLIAPSVGIALGGMLLFFVRRFGNSCSLLYWCAVGALPGATCYGTFMFMAVDHHCLETFFIWSWLILGAFHSQNPSTGKAILGGFAVFGFLTTWLGAPFFFLAIAVYLMILWVLRHPAANPLLEFSGAGIIIGSALTAAFLFYNPPRFHSLDFAHFGWFQPLLGIAIGIICQTLFALREKWSRRQRTALALFAISIIFILISTFLPAPFQQAKKFLMKQNPILDSIIEMQSLICTNPHFDFMASFVSIFQLFGFSILFFPVFFLAFSRNFSLPSAILIRDATIFIVALSILQIRFCRWLYPGQILVLGIVFNELCDFALRSYNANKIRSTLKAAIILCPLILIQLGMAHANISERIVITNDVIDSLNWVQRRTPVTSGFGDDKTPEYSILPFWDQGNKLTYYAQRPIVVSNMLLGLKRMADVLVATSEEEAFAACRESKIRYLFLTPMIWNKDQIKWLSDVRKQSGTASVLNLTGNAPETSIQEVHPENTFHYWMVEKLGLVPTSPDLSVSSHFLCRYISPTSKKAPQPYALIFETVEGAVISGTADPNSEVEAFLVCRIGAGEVPYIRFVNTDKNGIFRLRVAYPTSFLDGRVMTAATYRMRFTKEGRECIRDLSVPESDVLTGNVLQIQ